MRRFPPTLHGQNLFHVCNTLLLCRSIKRGSTPREGTRNQHNNMRRIKALWRLRLIRADAQRFFEGTVHHCARVTALNKDISFAVHRVGLFGGPKVEQIARPDNVQLSENDKCVIVKDGLVYRLNKEIC